VLIIDLRISCVCEHVYNSFFS